MRIGSLVEPRHPEAALPTAAVLFLTGSVIATVLSLLDPPHGGAWRTAVVVLVPVLLLATGLFLLTARARRSTRALVLGPLVGLVAIAATDLATHDAGITGQVFFCLPVLYAAAQLRVGAAALVTAVAVALDLAVSLALLPTGEALVAALDVGTVLVALTVVILLKSRRHEMAVAELERHRHRLLHQATHDALTGLPSRTLFHDRLRESLGPAVPPVPAASSPSGAPTATPSGAGERRTAAAPASIAVLLCDLDGFKQVNDTLGHRAGDELLVAVAARLRAEVRAGDVVARLGGDEFGILLLPGDEGGACFVADRVLAAFAQPVEVAGQRVHVGASIGITLAVPCAGDVPATGGETLLREADVAMYEAKAAGRGTRVVFAPAMLAAQVAEASLTQDLHGAVGRGEVVVEYQPVVDLTTGRVDGVEALCRWEHPVHGRISPATFVPLAERSGLIDEIGAFVLTAALRDAEVWAVAEGRDVSVGVNVSAHQLTGGKILAAVPSGRRGRTQLLLEVTESTLVRADVLPVLDELRRRGVRVAMDDFGTGQSSIAALRVMPVDVLKLDRAFTVDIATDARAAGIVRAVAAMAHELGLPMVAEGIETTAQHHALRDIGCGLGQGFLLARPMDAAATGAFLTRSPLLVGAR
ncbi:putative bifunctional diguanylate cyclase/phosphodiesterase [Cellulomonas marina]|uniref:Diguanylate cyclase (GGDEF) domain-containing protein n=1 Tax=Cellulomonas marina TaxID=988821 RepID=A0A1I1ARF7_9CELL|nr:EAL domain-containing protein [Cellulomonas marina]GIG30450.1 hypothetical protein Cma02nite_30500 [Cellulomonas marina]SFB39068.1 diguanylate cyclase (GGDEF) domain-containing protein [Cellulomonas marina]